MIRLSRPNLVLILIFVFLAILVLWPYLGRLYYRFDHREEIQSLAQIYELEPKLIAAVIHVESKFDPSAESPKGARGLMQIMPTTGIWAAAALNWDEFSADQLFDPWVNLQIGCWYLASLRDEFSNMTMALAAYNAGRGNVRKWLALEIWDGSWEKAEKIPFAETREYIFKVYRTLNHYQKLY